MFHITAAYAQLERAVLAERVRAGMDRARRQGKPLGRPKLSDDPSFDRRWRQLSPAIREGEISQRQAAALLGIGRASVRRLMDQDQGQ